ncbi:sigma-70 family RNA polymerase sigma factor [Xylophilus sp. GW821-FHT01B05]
MAAHYYQELLKYFSRKLRDQHAAADVVQEAYARVLAHQQAGQPVEHARGLLYRTARNILIDQERHDAVRAPETDAVLADMPAPAQSQPEEIYAATQRARQLVAAIEALPPRCREAFMLHRFEGLSHAEVAARMGISRNMVERHIMLAVLACKQHRDQPEAPAGR